MIKLPRKPRKDLGSNFVHVIVQGINREFILDKDECIRKYIHLLDDKKQDLSIYIVAYCIMNNHVHLLIYYEKLDDLSKYMQKVNTSFAKYYNEMFERVGFVFRDRYKCQPILDKKYLINCIKYIHNNPVRANIVKRCEEYPYSSYKDFLQKDKIEDINQKTGADIDLTSVIEYKITGYFIDIDEDINEKIDYGVSDFCKKENIEIYKLLEDKVICKKIINYLKNEWQISYVDIMKKFNISRGTLQRMMG